VLSHVCHIVSVFACTCFLLTTSLTCSEMFWFFLTSCSTIKCDYEYQKHLSGADSRTKCDYQSQNSSSRVEDELIFSEDGIESTPPFSQYKSIEQSFASSQTATLPEPNIIPTVPEENEAIFCDEDTFDKQFSNSETRIEVNAPPGKLGVIIDTASGDRPVVSSIKEKSPLADRVRVGDILISVDGETSTGLTASQASLLISSKASNPRRVLVFVRNANA